MTTTTKYFSGDVELTGVFGLGNEKFFAIGGQRSKANWFDSFHRLAGKSPTGELLPVTRKIFYKKNPSLHKCDARCQNAKGGICECSCGGKYHGIHG
jgi:hypothetical protein